MRHSAGYAYALLFAVLLVIALGLRVSQLERRPMHPDEANQAVRTGILQETGVYQYDPDDHHGPSLYYLSLPSAWLTSGRSFAGTTETTFRVIPALFGFALILLIYLMRNGIGWAAALFAGLFTAISPALVYYSRYYIQEMLLVFFAFGAIYCGWRYLRRPSPGLAVWTGVLLGFMYATKETAILSFAAMAVALFAASSGMAPKERRGWLAGIDRRHALIAVAAAVGTAVLLLTSLFTYPAGILESILSYRIYLARAAGDSLHVHPWSYYIQMLTYFRYGPGPVWSEGLIVGLAVIGAIGAWWGGGRGEDLKLLRFLSVYALVLIVLYSAIAHKSPWLLLSFLQPMAVLAGFGVVAALRAVRFVPLKAVVIVLVGLGVYHLAGLTWLTNFRYAADPRNPYVYAHTAPDLLNLVERVEQIAAIHPHGRELYIQVIAHPHNTWPLPWYFRKYGTVGYWETAEEVPNSPAPAIIIVSPDQEEDFGERLPGRYQAEFYGLRAGVLLMMYIRGDLWDAFLETRGGPPAGE
jgi:uncharacterized protein (TIGR03663 family)